MAVNYFFSELGYVWINVSPETVTERSILQQVYNRSNLRQLLKSITFSFISSHEIKLLKGIPQWNVTYSVLVSAAFFLSFPRPAENPSAIHRIKGTLFHWIPTFWIRYWINWLVSQCLFHSGSVFPLWCHVQHTVHSAIPTHCRVSQRRRGKFNV